MPNSMLLNNNSNKSYNTRSYSVVQIMNKNLILNVLKYFWQHSQIGDNPCELCDFVGAHPADLQKHQEKHKVQLSCEHCNFVTNLVDELKNHVKYKHSGRSHPCDECDHVATRADALRQHQNAIHKGPGVYYLLFSSKPSKFQGTTNKFFRIIRKCPKFSPHVIKGKQ